MTIYILGHWLSHYQFPHSEVVVCLNAAKGFIHHGFDARVVWFGEFCFYEGAPHIPVQEARPGANDVFLCMHPAIAAAVVQKDELKHLLDAGEKWIYTNAAYGEAKLHGSIYDAEWSLYDRIFVESEQSVAMVQAQFPSKDVDLCWLGCSHELDLESLTDPYPRCGSGSSRHLFFAGRLTHLEEMEILMRTIGPNYHLWIAARTFLVNGKWLYIRAKNEPAQNKWSPDVSCAQLSHSQGEDIIRGQFQSCAGRVHFLGALPFGSFWDCHHFAFASLDVGREEMPPTLNCKVFDALRAGSRVITYGESPSYFLLDKYQAGRSLPWKDFVAVRDELNSWEYELRADRLKRASKFRDGESWHSRVEVLIAALPKG